MAYAKQFVVEFETRKHFIYFIKFLNVIFIACVFIHCIVYKLCLFQIQLEGKPD